MTTNRTIKDALYEQVARIAKASASPKRLELIEGRPGFLKIPQKAA